MNRLKLAPFFEQDTRSESLRRDKPFPPHALALQDPNGLIAIGGGLGLDLLSTAYLSGIFPWFEDVEGREPWWWSPDPRAVLLPKDFHSSRSLTRRAKRTQPIYSVDKFFDEVMDGCATHTGIDEHGWLGPQMRKAYECMHEAGLAHSFEVCTEGSLAGGVLYVQKGSYVSCDTMFSAKTDGSKLALREICLRLSKESVSLLDCQIISKHLASLGAVLMPRDDFLEAMSQAQTAGDVDLSIPVLREQG